MDVERYARFIKDIELESVLLESVEAKRDWEKFLQPNNLNVYFEPMIGPTWKVRDQSLEVLASLVVRAVTDSEPEGASESDPALFIRTGFLLVYVYNGEGNLSDYVSAPGNEEILKAFVDKNVPVNAWPYFREMIASLTTRMGLPPLIVPTYKVRV